MHPLKTYYAQEIEIWMKNHLNRVFSHYQIAGLFGKTYLKSATAATAGNGFRKTGLFPCKRHIFDEHDFLEETQRNIRSCLLVVPVLRKSRLTLAAQIQSYQQSPRLPHKTLRLFSAL
jgi:hypothetical protein